MIDRAVRDFLNKTTDCLWL